VEEQVVKVGDTIVQLDDTDAKRKLRDATLELENAELELERLTAAGASNETGTQTSEAASVLADVFTNMPWLVDETGDILYGYDLESDRANINFLADKAAAFPETAQYRDAAASTHATAADLYRKTRISYQALNVADPAAATALLNDTEILMHAVVRSLVATQTFFTFVHDHYSSSQVPLRAIELRKEIDERAKTASDNLQAVQNARTSLAGSSSVPVSDIERRDAELRVEAARHAREDAASDLRIYTVLAPVAGRIASRDAYTGKPVVQGEILARIASPQNVARVALKEADIQRIRVGQKAEVTFDGIPGLVIAGEVIKVDSEASVVNNTVTFYAYIGFARDETRAKPGMTTTATIAL
jgi:multidrug resistance efflux pump